MKPKGVLAKKPVKAFPALRKRQRPLNDLSKARRQIAAVESLAMGGGEKFVAYTNLLSRAFAGERNPEVIKLISAERGRIRISGAKKSNLKKSLCLKRIFLLETFQSKPAFI